MQKLINIRESEKMQEDGFMVIPFPSHLVRTIQEHTTRFIAKATNSSLNPTEAVALLSDQEFIEKFSKPFRLFPDEIGHQMQAWVLSLKEVLGASEIGVNYVSPKERSINPTLQKTSYDTFWRCVRPNKLDVGKAHCDFQFWEIAKGTEDEAPCPFAYQERWKIWAPIFGCGKTNSIQMIPKSHLEEVPTGLIKTVNGPKPNIDADWLLKNESRFICPFEEFSNRCVLFHDKLVHRGPKNEGKELRISAEISILINP